MIKRRLREAGRNVRVLSRRSHEVEYGIEFMTGDKLVAVQKDGGWIDAMRMLVPEPTKLYTWWSYRAADWTVGDRGRRLDHIWVSRALKDGVTDFKITRDARSWERPSDHVPLICELAV